MAFEVALVYIIAESGNEDVLRESLTIQSDHSTFESRISKTGQDS